MKKCFVVIYCTLIAISCNSKMFEDISLYSGQEIPQNTNLTQGIVTDIYIITYDAPRNLYISKNMGLLFNKIDFGPNMSLEYFAVNNRGELLTVEYDNVSGKRYIRISFPQGGKTNCFNGELNITDSVAAVSESDEGDFFLCVQKAGTKKLLRRPLGTIDLYEMSDYTGTITYNISNLWTITTNTERFHFIATSYDINFYIYYANSDYIFTQANPMFTSEITDMGYYQQTIFLAGLSDYFPFYFYNASNSEFQSITIPVSIQYIKALHVDDSRQRFYVAANSTIFRTANPMEISSWVTGVKLTAPHSIEDIATDAQGRLYILSNDSLWRSDDGGMTATKINTIGGNKIKIATYSISTNP